MPMRRFTRQKRLSSYGSSKAKRTNMPRSGAISVRKRGRTADYSYGVTGVTKLYSSVGRSTPLYVKASPVVETHVLSFAYAPGNLSGIGVGEIIHLNDIGQGTALNQRETNRTQLMSLQMRGLVQPPVTAPALGQSYGIMMVIYDRQPQGTLPVWTDIMNAADPNEFARLDNRDRFQILWRKYLVTSGDQAQPTSRGLQTIDVNLNLKRLETTYSNVGGTGAISEVRTGGLYFIQVGGFPNLNNPSLALEMRLTFTP